MKYALPCVALFRLLACSSPDTITADPARQSTSTDARTVPSGAPAPSEAPTGPAPECAGRSAADRPVVVSFDVLRGFPGRDATKVAAVASLPEPVRVCGRHGASQFLANLHCADGSRPITSGDAAEKARVGEAPGRRGPCGSPLDRYRLVCGTNRVEIDLDLYWCSEDSYFDRSPYSDY